MAGEDTDRRPPPALGGTRSCRLGPRSPGYDIKVDDLLEFVAEAGIDADGEAAAKLLEVIGVDANVTAEIEARLEAMREAEELAVPVADAVIDIVLVVLAVVVAVFTHGFSHNVLVLDARALAGVDVDLLDDLDLEDLLDDGLVDNLEVIGVDADVTAEIEARVRAMREAEEFTDVLGLADAIVDFVLVVLAVVVAVFTHGFSHNVLVLDARALAGVDVDLLDDRDLADLLDDGLVDKLEVEDLLDELEGEDLLDDVDDLLDIDVDAAIIAVAERF
jgi:hypothetical protein